MAQNKYFTLDTDLDTGDLRRLRKYPQTLQEELQGWVTCYNELTVTVEGTEPNIVRVDSWQGLPAAVVPDNPADKGWLLLFWVSGRYQGTSLPWCTIGLLVITNAHVVGRGSLEVILPVDRKFPTKILAHDPERDLAALSVDAHNLPTVELGNSNGLQPGQLVLALGHPWGWPVLWAPVRSFM